MQVLSSDIFKKVTLEKRLTETQNPDQYLYREQRNNKKYNEFSDNIDDKINKTRSSRSTSVSV